LAFIVFELIASRVLLIAYLNPYHSWSNLVTPIISTRLASSVLESLLIGKHISLYAILTYRVLMVEVGRVALPSQQVYLIAINSNIYIY